MPAACSAPASPAYTVFVQRFLGSAVRDFLISCSMGFLVFLQYRVLGFLVAVWDSWCSVCYGSGVVVEVADAESDARSVYRTSVT